AVVHIAQRGALRYRPGVQRLDETVSRCCCDLGFDPVTKPVDLGTLIIDLGLLQIDLLVGERDKVTMCDLWQRTPCLPLCCNEYNIVVSSSPCGGLAGSGH